MKLIIDIPDRLIKKVKDHYVNPYEVDEICEAILDGVPLPEHHGRLIDEAEVIKSLFDFVKGTKTIGQCIDDTPTIIEGSEAE